MSKIYHKKCKWCGDHFESENRNKKICPACDESRNGIKIKPPKEDKLGDMLREVDEYNREHGTALSYGQYVSKFGK